MITSYITFYYSLWSLLWQTQLCSSYLVVLDNDSNSNNVTFHDNRVFAANVHSSKDYHRRYYMNVDRNAAFVEKLLYVSATDGFVFSKEPLECSGVKYPSLFTLYVDSVSNGTFEYISIPLRIYIKGCDIPVRATDFVEVEDYYNKKLTDIANWYSETLVSYALPGTRVFGSDPLRETCFSKDQHVMRIRSHILPHSIVSICDVRYIDISDPRLSFNDVGDLKAANSFCIPLDPPWKVKITISYDCNSAVQSKNTLISPAFHHIKVVFWHRREANEVGRVRRDAPSGSVDGKIPQFEKALYVASVSEEQPPGVSVCTVHASSDSDGGGEILYQMVPLLDGRSHSMFAIDSQSGIITTSVSLDREQLDVHYFRVQAVDLSYRPYSATSTVQINVMDINDHGPVFESANGEYEATVKESIAVGSIITAVRASDKDIGHNGQIEYTIRSVDDKSLSADSSDNANSIFSLDSSSGVLSTRLPLDRETAESYKLMIVATDQASPASERKSSTATIVVHISDENDNYPQFAERAYTATVAEDAITSSNPNPIVATVKATDSDEGANAAIRYAIISGNTQGQFSIDSQSGEVSLVKSLDYETMRSYRLLIRAQDGGSPSHSNTTQLLVNVKDVNDNAPRFSSSLFQESVLENVPVGFSIVRVQAYDSDEGENAVLKYSLGERDSQGTLAIDLPITVDENTGWVYTVRPLDRETSNRYQLQVLAQDNGIPSKTASASVVITVQDVNDNDPTFNPKNYEAVVSESDPPGTPVTSLLATDPDENPRIHYEITNGNARGRFAVTAQNGRGLITIAQPLDYKQEKRFVLTVKATDSGGRSDTATVYVNVSDANNFAPNFENAPYSTSVFEDVPVGTTVLIVTATDSDVGPNAQITYSLANENEATSEFSINAETGAIVTTRLLDRESRSSYLLTITAKDSGIPSLSDTTDVEISVADINDNPPQFLKLSYVASISEDALVGTSVLQVSAVDVDSGLNGRVRYAMQGQGSGDAFIIDATSGVIRTAASLDRESVARYEIEAIAIDRGSPALSATALVTIKIDDVNDSPPTFDSEKLVYHIAENSPIGSRVGVLHAKDPDEGPNGLVQYSIIGGEDANSFSLVQRQGVMTAELVTMVELDYESTKKKYDLIVRAASPPLRSDVHVDVLVTDVNDNAPVLKDFHVIFNNFKDSFVVGPFAKVPAFDADVNDKLRYRVLSGNNANLISVNESTGHISLSPQLNTNVPKTALLELSVSDGVNEASASMQLMVRLVTDDMLHSSVTVRLNDITQLAFLSPLYTYFVEALAAIIPCPKENVYVFSILDDTDRILNVSFSARRPDGFFYSSQYLKEKLYLNRMALAKLSTLQILPFDDNLCVREPCLNFEHCSSVLKFGNASSFISSDTVLFRPIYPVSSFTCHCPFGFTGKEEHYLCDMEVNLCYSNPCSNGGTCHPKEGGYTCTCSHHYTGDNCEIDITTDGCSPLYCHSGSTCTPLPQGGFICDNCAAASSSNAKSDHQYDRVCQLRSRSFSKNSFLTFSSLNQRNRLHLALRFATLEDSGLLLYNGRYNEHHDFIALEITAGGQSVQFSFSLGDSVVTRVTASLPYGVNDGSWHSVIVSYYNRSATISLDDCDTALTIRYGPQMGYLCANYSSHVLDSRCAVLTETCYRFLDLTGPLQIGGLPSFASSTAFQVQHKYFTGCIADLYIDHQLLDLNRFVADNGTISGCPEKKSYCTDNPCHNGATCSDSWGTFYCECPDGWSGKDCSQSSGPAWRFSGDGGMLLFNPLLRSVQLPWSVSFSIRTLQSNAFIISVQIGQNSSAVIALESGFIVYYLDDQSVMLNAAAVNDGLWHRVEITWLASGGGGSIRLSLDYEKRVLVRSINAKIQGLYMGKVIIGSGDDDISSKNDNMKKWLPFSGCIVDVKIGSTQMLQRPAVQTRVTEDCQSLDPCVANKCPKNSQCIPVWEKYTCKCFAGFVGPACLPVCETNPCSNGARCIENSNSTRGYQCMCDSPFYSGEYCEIVIEQTCPVSWWGHPVCGPCNCPSEFGYNPDCNKTTGECTCKENHYQPKGSSRCLPCECYSTGSYDVTCNKETGHCRCRAGVIGRRCDSCPSPFAEVTLRGCEVIYDGCPENYANGIWWSRTKFGVTSVQYCPIGSQGKASRLCDNDLAMWRLPDVFNCTSDAFIELKKILMELEAGNMKMNTFLAVECGSMIRRATNMTTSDSSSRLLYGTDVLIAQQIIRQLLDYEQVQSGLNLTHSQDKDYMQNIVLGINRIINLSEYNHWEGIRKLTNETPEVLILSIWKYLITLATNQHDTYTDPFEVVTSNFVIGLDVVTAESLFGYETEGLQIDSNPEISSTSFSSLGKQQPSLPQEKVVLPDAVLDSGLQINSLKTRSPLLGTKRITSPAVIFPKYNNYLMDTSKFDPHSQIMIPIDLFGIKSISQGEIGSKNDMEHSDNAVVGYAEYRNVGALLPMKYDETVVKRWGVDLIVGSPVISVIAANNRHFEEHEQSDHPTRWSKTELLDAISLPTPIRIRIWLNTQEMSSQLNPQCVRWTISRGFGEWTRAGCVTSVPDFQQFKSKKSVPVLVNCTCNQFSTYAVLVDLIEHQYVSEFTVIEDMVFWISYVLAIVALTIACFLLSILRAKTNSSSICINLVFSLLMAQCLYLFVLKSNINIVSNEFACKLSAIGLHYAWLTVMGWSLVSSLHLYRMLTEMRDVNHGQMAFYHAVGYALPAVVVGLAVGVRADQYGNYAFCWLSLYESVVWSLIGPVCMIVVCNLLVLLLSLRAAFALKDHIAGYGNLRTLLWLNVVSQPLLVAVWMMELLNGTERDMIITYVLSLLVVVQAWFMLCGYCFVNARIRVSLSRVLLRASGRKVPPIPEEDIDSPLKTTSQSPRPTSGPRSALAYRNAGVNTFQVARRQIAISTSSTTSRSTGRTTSSPYRSDMHLRKPSTPGNNYERSATFQRAQHTSDSDSEGSAARRHSLDLASSHSSDEDYSSRSQSQRQRGTARQSNNKRRNVADSVASSSVTPQTTLPNVIEETLTVTSGSRMPTIQPPQHLNIIANSELFPNADPDSPLYYTTCASTRWNNHLTNNTTAEEMGDSPYTHRWATDNSMRYDPRIIEDRYSVQNTHLQHDNNYTPEYEDRNGYNEKYSFPFTAEEDHCTSSYLNLMRAAHGQQLSSVRKLSGTSDSPNLDQAHRMCSNRSSVRSTDMVRGGHQERIGGGNVLAASLRNVDTMVSRNIDEGLHVVHGEAVYNRRGSDLSVRPVVYESNLISSRRNSDVENDLTTPFQKRPIYSADEIPVVADTDSDYSGDEEDKRYYYQ